MKRLHPFAFVIILFFTGSCSDNELDYVFKELQSETIQSFRHQNYYEYNSRLNDSMWKTLQSFDKSILHDVTINTIEYLDKKIKSEKPAMGCYLIPWKHGDKHLKINDAIMLEWNPNAGVIIRVFTKSEFVKELLPSRSF